MDQGVHLLQMMHEVQHGPLQASQARDLLISGGYKIPMVLYVDAMSVFAAVTATFIKTPAEKSLLCHVQYLRELLDRGTLSAIVWLDTRDMISDGLTKGVISRKDLMKLMDGVLATLHAPKSWSSKLLRV